MRWLISFVVVSGGRCRRRRASNTNVYTDDLGRVVTVPLHPQRIVSMHDRYHDSAH